MSAWSSRPDRSLQPRSPRSVEVQGHPAEYGSLDPDFGPYPRAVLWQNAQDQWFRVSCGLDQKGILQVAEGVRAAPNPMRLPFALAALPDGTSLKQLIESTREGRRAVTAQFEMTGEARSIMEVSNQYTDTLMQGPVKTRTVAGRTVEIRPAAQSICFPTQAEPICISGPGDEPATDWSGSARAVALQTAELLTPVDDPSNEASWLDADVALPV